MKPRTTRYRVVVDFIFVLLLSSHDDWHTMVHNTNGPIFLTTYGFSLSTLHTDAIVQKQSVAFPSVREGFCKQK